MHLSLFSDRDIKLSGLRVFFRNLSWNRYFQSEVLFLRPFCEFFENKLHKKSLF